MNTITRWVLALAVGFLVHSKAVAGEPDWAGRVLKGEQRESINSKPVEEREYRPFHFYGNTVRRRYYRGLGVPLPRDLFFTVNALLRGR